MNVLSQTTVGHWLADFVITKLYPAVVFSVLVAIVACLVATVIVATDWEGAARRLIGVVIPIVALIIFVEVDSPRLRTATQWLGQLHVIWQFVIGAGIGVILTELSRYFLDKDASAAIFAMFLATLGAFILWAVIGGALGTINIALLGLVFGVGGDVMLIGFP